MVGQSRQSEGVLSWVDLSRKDQARWMVSYLLRVQSQSKLASYLLGKEAIAEARYGQAILGGSGTLESVIQKKIMDDLSQRYIAEDAPSLKLIERMRWAWQQRKYREKNGKQVSFQLPKNVADEIEKIARDRGQSRTYTLEQMVTGAADAFQAGSLRSERKIESLQRRLKRAEAPAQDVSGDLSQRIELLQELLVKEVMACCEYEACPPGAGKIDGDLFDLLLEQRIKELEKLIPDIALRMSRIRSVKDLFAYYRPGSPKF